MLDEEIGGFDPGVSFCKQLIWIQKLLYLA